MYLLTPFTLQNFKNVPELWVCALFGPKMVHFPPHHPPCPPPPQTWEPDFFQAWSFWIMLMNHKNIHFTQIPDKTNDMIFLKSLKTMFWAIFDQFWSFLPDGDFFKKFGSVTDKCVLTPCIWFPNTTNPEKTYVQTEGRTEGRTHRQNLFCRTLLVEAGVQ